MATHLLDSRGHTPMRNFPIDATRLQLISTGYVTSCHEWVERDGRRQPAEAQMTDENGTPLWDLSVLVMGGDDKPETLNVRVSSRTQPETQPMQPVAFERL